MGNKTLIRATIIGLVLLTLFTITMMVLIGKNGLINQEIKKYNDTHVEERSEEQNKDNKDDKVVIIEDEDDTANQ